MSNGGDKSHHEEKKPERKEPQAVAGKASGQVKRPTSGK